MAEHGAGGTPSFDFTGSSSAAAQAFGGTIKRAGDVFFGGLNAGGGAPLFSGPNGTLMIVALAIVAGLIVFTVARKA